MGVHPSDPTRARILRAATELFAERGFRRTGVRAICAKARTNVAAVNYHFRSKKRLYLEVFRIHFDGVHQPLLALPDQVRDAESWRQALTTLVDYMLRTGLSERPPEVWVARLIAHERAEPTAVARILHEQLFDPLLQAVERLVRLGMPPDGSDLDAHLLAVSLLAQCIIFHYPKRPLKKLVFPNDAVRENWIARAVQIIVGGITCRYAYAPPAARIPLKRPPATRKSP